MYTRKCNLSIHGRGGNFRGNNLEWQDFRSVCSRKDIPSVESGEVWRGYPEEALQDYAFV